MAQKSNGEAIDFDPKNPNAILDLSKFDYDKTYLLKGESFKDYISLLEKLCPKEGHARHTDTGFDFELHEAKPIYEVRYPGIPNSPSDLVGVELKVNPKTNSSVLYKTRISIKHARDLNLQIENAHSRAGFGRFFLLAKN